MGLLLIEPAVDESSIEKNIDPSTLVSTPAKIKELIKAKIDEVAPGNLPDYKFNKQLSSACITDLDGNKVLEDSFSYIAKAGDYLLLAKNTPDTEIKVFSIPENKLIEVKKEDVAPVVENSEAVIPSLDTSAVQETEASDLNSVYGENAEADVPVDESLNNLSFDEITSETPTNEVGGETPMANTMSEADFDAALASLGNDKQDMITAMQDGKSFIEEQNEEYDPLADYQGFHEDKLEYDTTDSNNDYALDDSLEVVKDTTATEFVQAFEDLRKDNANKDRELSEARGIIEKLKISIEKKDAENERLRQGKELATSAIRDLRETAAKQAAEIERVRNAADIYKGKADGFKYELAEKDREIARLKSQAEGINDIRSALERYKAGKEYNDSYSDAEEYMKY